MLQEDPGEFRIGARVRFFNYNFDEAIRRKGWTRKEFAAKVGVAGGTVYGWMGLRGFPNQENRVKVAALLGVPEDRLFPQSIQAFKILKQPEPLVIGAPIGQGDSQLAIEAHDILFEGDPFIKAALTRALAALPERDRMVLAVRFGLDGQQEHTLEAAGKGFGVSRARVGQMEAKALRKLRNLLPVETLQHAVDTWRCCEHTAVQHRRYEWSDGGRSKPYECEVERCPCRQYRDNRPTVV